MKFINLLFALIIIGLSISCEKKEPEKSSEAKLIKAFCESGDGIIDTISNKVTFKVPEETDLTKIIPQFEISANATIYPPSGVATDYSEPVVYTITSEDTTNQYIFTVYAFKPIAEFTVYDCSNWTPTSNRDPQGDAIIKIYSSQEDVGTTKTFDILTTDQNAQATLYGLKGISYFFTVEKDNKSNIVDGYVLAGTYNNQVEVDSSCDPNATVGGLRFKDVNGDGCVWPDDKYNYDIISVSTNLSGIKYVDLYIASTE